jgi:hypothetical protein
MTALLALLSVVASFTLAVSAARIVLGLLLALAFGRR